MGLLFLVVLGAAWACDAREVANLDQMKIYTANTGTSGSLISFILGFLTLSWTDELQFYQKPLPLEALFSNLWNFVLNNFLLI